MAGKTRVSGKSEFVNRITRYEEMLPSLRKPFDFTYL
jgi:hypothetical protein